MGENINNSNNDNSQLSEKPSREASKEAGDVSAGHEADKKSIPENCTGNLQPESTPEKFKKISIDNMTDEQDKRKSVSKSSYADNNLELLGMSRREKKAARKKLYSENTKAMSRKEKFSYLFDYYKWYVIIPLIAVVFIAYLSVTIYQNKRPVALGYAILNSDEENVNLSFKDDYLKYFGIEDGYQFKESVGRDIDYDYYLLNKDYIQTSNSTDYNIIMSECEMNYYDVVISNAAGVKFCTTEKVARPLKGYFDAEVYQKLEKYMVSFPESNGSEVLYAVDISGTDFAKGLNLGYSDVYVIFPGTSETNYINSLRLLEYALGIDLDTEAASN